MHGNYNLNSAAKSQLSYICMCVGFSPAGSVTLRSVIIALPEPGTTGMQKYMISYVDSKNVTRCLTVNSKKENADMFKTIKRCV